MRQNIQFIIKRVFLLFFLLTTSLGLFAQEISISGIVTDGKDGSPIIGATVIVKGTTIGTTTNFEGKYTIKSTRNSILVFSFIGYEVQEIAVDGRTQIDAVLFEQMLSLEEIIVIGYGNLKKSDRTGAVVNIGSEELNRGVLTDPIQGLQGKIAGVNISKKGGDPNAGFTVQIRGAAGFSSNTEPLYVIDGVSGADPTTVSSEDIESFNILKDASSGAIYGSRASNGVVIITTKKAKNQKEVIVDYNSYVSQEKMSKTLDFLTADDIRQYVIDNNISTFSDNGANTNWQDEIFRTGISQSHNFAVSNSTDNLAYRLSYSHMLNNGIVIGSSKQRDIARLNISQSALNKKLTIEASLAGTFEHNNYINYGGGMGASNVFYQTYQRNPTDPVYQDGDFFEFQRDFNYNNPVAIAKRIQNERDAKKFFGTTKISLELIEGLVASTSLSYVRNDNETYYFEPTNIYAGGHNGFGRRSYNNFESKLLETTVSYTKSINSEHNLNLLGGYSFQEDAHSGLSAQGRDALSNYLMSNNLAHLNTVLVSDIGSWRNSNRLISFFGRGIYNYKSKYYVTATIRRDGSSKFGVNNEWGIFPSGSIAWDIKKESFMENIGVLNQLKLRIGYGLTGNQEIGSYLDVMYAYPNGTAPNFETGEDAINFSISHNANPDLKWEENSELNIGLEYGILNNRIQGSIDYYLKSTYDLLAPYSVPVPPNPLETTWANVGQIDNRGLEINIQGFVIDKKEFKWKTITNFATNKQKLVKLSGVLNGESFNWSVENQKRLYLSGRGLVGAGNWTQYLFEGEEIGTFYMPEYAGLSQDGKFLFYTAAGGVTRNVSDAERRKVGHAQPKFTLGWSNFFTYKNFDLNIALRGSFGNQILNVTRMVFANPQVLPTLNGLTEVLDEIDRGLTDYPKISDYYLEDASFIKIDNISIGYNFKINKNLFIRQLRVYLTSSNLYTFTKYTGFDPETTYSGLEYGIDQYDLYPKTRSITFGIDVKF
jgi:iron complex outermembrane receptor protein